MALKDELIKKAESLGIKVEKMTIAQLQDAIQKAENETPNESSVEEESQTFTKAGRRSRKSVAKAEAEVVRLARKEEKKTEDSKSKPKQNPPRPKSERRGKKYKEVVKALDLEKKYELQEALSLIGKTSITKFDSSIDLTVSLGIDPKKADQKIRDFVVLPSGLGKEVRVAVFAEDEEVKEALEAGASVGGKEVFLQQLDKGLIDFDILITTPSLMSQLGKYAQLLGSKGLMPNPKSGTITKNIVKTVKEALAGRIEYRANEYGLVHLSIGKVSFSVEELESNLQVVLESLQNNRPASFKGVYIQQMSLSTTMGPSLKLVNP